MWVSVYILSVNARWSVFCFSLPFLSFFIDMVILLRWFWSACPGYDRGVGCKRSEVIRYCAGQDCSGGELVSDVLWCSLET